MLYYWLYLFQSSFELTGYITNKSGEYATEGISFQSSFELTGYITKQEAGQKAIIFKFQSSFELTGYITYALWKVYEY